MPSATFFNLPEEKREKLLQAAREEFARVPFPQASVNQMIQAAGIPRGSFYMYFTDKEELFQYLMEEYGAQMGDLMRRLLAEVDGDLFCALPAAFDHVTGGHSQVCASLMSILHRNTQMRPDLVFVHDGHRDAFRWMQAYVRLETLDIRQEEDFGEMLGVLMVITGGAVVSVARGEPQGLVRERLCHILEILKRGMVKPQFC